ncbi:MAG: hypothetical protein ACI853_001729, partial [Paracoccaceae bacterium]
VVPFDQSEEIPRRIEAEGRFAKMRILGQEIFRCREKIGEITTPAPRNADFLACGFGVINHQNAPAGVCCTHQTGRASPED